MIYWKYMCLIKKTKGYWYLKIAYIIFLNQDAHEREFVNCDPFLRQIFQTDRMKFAEIPQRLNPLLHPPDPIVSTNYYSSSTKCLNKNVHLNLHVKIWYPSVIGDQSFDHSWGIEAPRAKKDCVLRYWCRSGRYTKNADE